METFTLLRIPAVPVIHFWGDGDEHHLDLVVFILRIPAVPVIHFWDDGDEHHLSRQNECFRI